MVIRIYQADPTTGANIGPWNLTPYGGSIAVQVEGDFVPVVPTSLGIIPGPIHFKSLSMMLSEAN